MDGVATDAQPARYRGGTGQQGRAPSPLFPFYIRHAAHPAVPAGQGGVRRSRRAHLRHHQVGVCMYLCVCVCVRARACSLFMRPREMYVCVCVRARALSLSLSRHAADTTPCCNSLSLCSMCACTFILFLYLLVFYDFGLRQQLDAHCKLAPRGAGVGKRHAPRTKSRTHSAGI
jgi:hypothetical protein